MHWLGNGRCGAWLVRYQSERSVRRRGIQCTKPLHLFVLIGADGPWQLAARRSWANHDLPGEATWLIHPCHMATYAFGVFGFIPSIERSISNGVMGEGPALCLLLMTLATHQIALVSIHRPNGFEMTS